MSTVIRYSTTPKGFLQVVTLGWEVYVQHYRTQSHDGKAYMDGQVTLHHTEEFIDEVKAIELFDEMVLAAWRTP